MLNDLASRMGLKTKDGAGNRGSMNSATEAIPRKPKDQKRGGGTPATTPGSATRGRNANHDANGGGCDLCKKYIIQLLKHHTMVVNTCVGTLISTHDGKALCWVGEAVL